MLANFLINIGRKYTFMKTMCFLLLFIIGVSTHAETFTVLDSATKQPVPFATVLLKSDTNIVYGNYCGRDGKIDIDFEKSFDNAEISCVGYQNRIIDKASLTNTILLNKDIIDLDEVVINKTIRNFNLWGYTNFKMDFIVGLGKGMEEVVFIDNAARTPLLVKSFMFRIEKAKSKIAVRVHFYKKIANKMEPDEEMLTEDLVTYIEPKTKGAVEVDVSGFNVYLPAEGAFIGIEALGKVDDATGDFVDDTQYGDVGLRLEYNYRQGIPATFVRNRFRIKAWDNNLDNQLGLDDPDKHLNASFGIKTFKE